MAVEIKELIIRARVDYGSSKETMPKSEAADLSSLPSEEAMVKACVKQVLKILKQKKKR
jgi:hypothetical protein